MVPADPSCKPAFCKILLEDFRNKLSIPPKFVNDVIGWNCKMATIRSPLGKSWHVKIKRDIDRLYFAEGWHEFVNANDLHHGYFLEFTYEGDMVFNVAIFDFSLCEKREVPIVLGREDDNDTEHFTSSRGKPKMGFHGKCKASKLKPSTAVSMQPSIIAKEPGKCLRDLNLRGPHFHVTMKETNLTRAYMTIPRKFVCEELPNKNLINLRNSKGNLWRVSLLFYGHPERPTYMHSQFGAGWKDFCTGNNVEVGDTCLFELVLEERDVMQVHIIKP